ncbi:MAG: DNA polymerase III subunit delta' [Moraxellaceae bacterium]|nr:DNA polymerase III subunit delta' [Moraxellaceae bacterium]
MSEAPVTWPFHAYAWQLEAWQQLMLLLDAGRLPHALLLGGPAGIGKERFVQAFAARLLCAQPQAGVACGQCKSCHLLGAGTHPDLVWLRPETDEKTGKTAKAIKVDQVRELVDFAAKSAQMGGYRVVVISPAHLLNVQAANALLKTLEEPGRETVLLLVTAQPMALVATVRSRCQRLVLPVPSAADAMAWLRPQVRDEATAQLLLSLSQGAPLAALALRDAEWFGERERLLQDLLQLRQRRQTALAVAQRWHALGAESVLTVLGSLVDDMAVVASGATVVKHVDLAPIIATTSRQLLPARLLAFRQELAVKQRLLAGNVQGNALVDAAFAEWQQLALP